jgi:hypothetical protein
VFGKWGEEEVLSEFQKEGIVYTKLLRQVTARKSID